MKIALFNSEKAWGGGEKWYADVAGLLYNDNYEVFLFAHKEGKLIENVDVKISKIAVRVNNLSFLNPFKIIFLYRIFKTMLPDVLIINLPSDLKFAGIAARLAGIKKVIYRRGSAKPIKNSWLNRFIFKHLVHIILANSEQTKRTILMNNRNLFPEERIKVIYNGIEIPDRDIQKKNLQSVLDLHIIGCAGRLSPEKGFNDLIPLTKLLIQKNLHFRIVIAGEGPLQNELLKEIQSHNLTESINLVGFQKDFNAFLTPLDLFILPSYYEGFGYVLIEAMAHGKPVLAFDIGTTKEIILNEKTGYVIPGRNLDIMADRIINLCNNKELREEMGKSAFEDVSDRFSLKSMYNRLNHIINE